jgi:hypothetical protein
LIKENTEHLKPPKDLRGNDRPQVVLALKVRAFTEKPFTPPTGIQTIYIAVQDQYRIPLTGAHVNLLVKFPDGSEEQADLPVPTDKNGFAKHTIDFENQPPGVVEIHVNVEYEGIQSQTITSFRVW